MHWGDLGHVTGISVGGLIVGHQAAEAPGVPDVPPFPQFSSGPRNTWKHVQDQAHAPEIPRRTIFLATAACSREDGDSFGLLSGRGWGLSPPGSRQGYGSIADLDALTRPGADSAPVGSGGSNINV
jgi:hypothetical protein